MDLRADFIQLIDIVVFIATKEENHPYKAVTFDADGKRTETDACSWGLLPASQG